MRELLKTVTFAAALALAPLAAAADPEEDGTAAEAGAAQTADPTLSMGEEVPEQQVGQTYVRDTHGDWQLRCVRAPEGQADPCQLYQLLRDDAGNSVAEISIFPLQGEPGAAAGATVVTPLETLLTQRMRLSVDGGATKRYEFTWCSQVGCFARIGLTDEDVASFKKGAAATMTITPVAAPDQNVALRVSLKGFTAGFDAMLAAVGQ